MKTFYLLLFTLVSVLARAQGFEFDSTLDGKADSGYLPRWDSSYNRLLVYRNASAPDMPSARIFANSGTSVPIFILHDFREAKFANIWAAAATPEGGMVLSVIVGFGHQAAPKNASTASLKSLVLTYGPDGALKKVWNVAPYHHKALAVDSSGNVFALGVRDAGPEGFPMLMKYSKSGDVLGEYLPSSTFAKWEKALDGNPLNGNPALFVHDQQLVIWVSSTREIFKLSLNGELQRKFGLGAQVDRLAAQNGFAQGTIAGLALNNLGGLALQVRFWPAKDSAQGLMVGMVDVSPDGAEAKITDPLVSAAATKQQFLGLSGEGKHVVLESPSKGKVFIHTQ